MKRIKVNGKEYLILPCPTGKCKGRFLYPVSPGESRGYCDTCGHEEFFKIERKTPLKGKR